jgi:hypothetical protein
LNKFQQANDEKSVCMLGFFIRRKIIQRLDTYLNSLARFRYESNLQFENFELELNKFLINSLDYKITLKDAYSKFNTKTNGYKNMVITYRNCLNSIIKDNYDLKIVNYEEFKNAGDLLDEKFKTTDHSHYIYMNERFTYFKELVVSFHKIIELLPGIFNQYVNLLANKYDNLTTEEAFAPKTGKINSDILNKFSNGVSLDDVKNIFQLFNDKVLDSSLNNLIKTIPSKNQTVLHEVSRYLRKSLVKKTQDYVDELIEFRRNAFIIFNDFENVLYKYLSTYDVIRNHQLRLNLENIIFESKNYSKTKIDKTNFNSIYSSVLAILLNKQFDESSDKIKKILNDMGNKLNPYLKDVFLNLFNLLNNYINWYEKPEIIKQSDFNIYQVKTTSAILSSIIRLFKDNFNDCFIPDNELRIINSNNLFVDCDLNGKEYSGTNLVIISPNIELVNGKLEFNIKTDGNDAEDIYSNKSAKNASKHDMNGNGMKGDDGNDGKPGLSGGHVYIVTNKLPLVNVTARGGKGGCGQSGGDGSSGKDGKDGKDGDKDAIYKGFDKWYNWKFNIWSYRVTKIGTDGLGGGNGGDSGSGGYAGDSGTGGFIKLISFDDLISEFKDNNGEYNTINGKSGKPGK